MAGVVAVEQAFDGEEEAGTHQQLSGPAQVDTDGGDEEGGELKQGRSLPGPVSLSQSRPGESRNATVTGQDSPLLLTKFPLVIHQVFQYDCHCGFFLI